MARYPVAYVEWNDSGICAHRWEDREEVLRDHVHHGERLFAAGLLIEQTPEGIVLCVAINERIDDVSSCMAIPKENIKRMVVWNPNIGRVDGG